MQQGRTDEAEQALRASVACARDQEAKSWELRSAATLATLLADGGRADGARALLSPVCAWFGEGVDTQDLIEAKALLARLR